jgi:hypothetical protein
MGGVAGAPARFGATGRAPHIRCHDANQLNSTAAEPAHYINVSSSSSQSREMISVTTKNVTSAINT